MDKIKDGMIMHKPVENMEELKKLDIPKGYAVIVGCDDLGEVSLYFSEGNKKYVKALKRDMDSEFITEPINGNITFTKDKVDKILQEYANG